jgi:hypothetical protein
MRIFRKSAPFLLTIRPYKSPHNCEHSLRHSSAVWVCLKARFNQSTGPASAYSSITIQSRFDHYSITIR